MTDRERAEAAWREVYVGPWVDEATERQAKLLFLAGRDTARREERERLGRWLHHSGDCKWWGAWWGEESREGCTCGLAEALR